MLQKNEMEVKILSNAYFAVYTFFCCHWETFLLAAASSDAIGLYYWIFAAFPIFWSAAPPVRKNEST